MSTTKRKPKRSQRETVVNALALLAALSFVVLQVYRALTAGQVGDSVSLRNFAFALVVLGGLILSFTPLWQPVMYLIGALFIGTVSVFWALREPVTVAFEVIRLAVGIGLFLLLVYLFFRDRARFEREHGQDETRS